MDQLDGCSLFTPQSCCSGSTVESTQGGRSVSEVLVRFLDIKGTFFPN
jgi:hypothetical protein